MDTVTCETCSAEIRGDNVGAHFGWHEAQEEALEAVVVRAVSRMKTDALEAPGPATPREELSEDFGEEMGEEREAGARTPS